MELSGIGLAGCGRMGQPMLAALRDAGFDAVGFDVRAPQSYGEFAAAMSDDVARFAAHLKILISVVRDIEQTEALLFDTQALAAAAPGLRSIIICSTLSPRYLQTLKGRLPSHINLVDAPMSGASIAARERRLSFMMGGEEADLTALRPLFEAMGTSFHTMGPFAAGMTAKVLNNLLAVSSTAMTRLVLDWADELGLDEKSLLALIDKSSGRNWFASGFEDIEFARDGHAPDNTIGILEKDISSALDAAPRGADSALPNAVIEALRKLKPRL
uniref:NAD(P)-dependent oxidoreductase n=1 Tax=Pararhizobium sp. IMCC3301 TaxID=3067904 RepID=UPI002741BB89|nr:NAD(P)-binding domain-containing protein [Pararhizobium sp. IMCC3301]